MRMLWRSRTRTSREFERWCAEMAAAARAKDGTSPSGDRPAPAPLPALVSRVVSEGAARGDLAGAYDRLRAYFRLCHGIETRPCSRSLVAPLLVLVVGYFVVMFFLAKVAPVFADIFCEFGKGLPWPTQFIVDLSDFAVRHGLFSPWCVTAVALLGCLVLWLDGNGVSLPVLDSLKLRLPVLGRAPYLAAVARFSQALSALAGTGIPIADSLEPAARASGTTAFRTVADVARRRLEHGDSLAKALAAASFFDRTYCRLLENDEKSKGTEHALSLLAELYAGAASARWVRPNMVIPLLLVAALLLFLGFFIMALYMPLFTLGDAISGS